MHTYFIPECIHLACEQYKFFKIVITWEEKEVKKDEKSYFIKRRKKKQKETVAIALAQFLWLLLPIYFVHPDAEATTNSSYWLYNLFEIKNECNEC